METALFRREALDAHANQWIGDPRHGVGISITYIVYIIIFSSLSLIVILLTCTYSSRGIVSGQIIPRGGILQLTSTINGHILKKVRSEGDYVEKGDVLFVVSAGLQPTNGLTPSDLIGSLQVAKGRLESEIARELGGQLEKHTAFEAKTSAVQMELSAIRRQITAQNQVLGTGSDLLALYERSRSLGIVANVTVAERRQQFQQQRAQLAEYERQMYERQSGLASLRLEKSASDAASADKIVKWRSDLDNLNRQLLDIESSREVSIIAPAAGTISAVQATPGQSVALGQIVGTLLPSDSELVAVALVPSRLIGRLKVGSSARIRLDSFPYLRFGTLDARIDVASQGPVASLALNIDAESKEGYYRIELSIPQTLDGIDGVAHELRPGMNFTAVLQLERRRIYQWILPHLMVQND